VSSRSLLLSYGLPIAGLTSLVTGIALVVRNRPESPAELPPRPPAAAPLGLPGARVAYIGATALSEPPGEAIQVAASRQGVVDSVDVEVGAVVSAGQVLFRLDPRAARAEVAVRRAARSTAEAELLALKSQVGPRQATVEAATAGLGAARARTRAAAAELADRRYLSRLAAKLLGSGAIQPEEAERRQFAVDQAEAGLAEAEAEVARAEAELARVRLELARLAEPATGAEGPDLAVAGLRVAQAAAGVDAAETELELLTVRASVSGRVLRVNLRPGELAPAAALSEGLLVLGRAGRTRLRVQIDEVDIARFRPAARAWATPRGDSRRVLALRLVRLEPLVRP
jgi:HlyD family secretion protein